jgi:hypothetical protein
MIPRAKAAKISLDGLYRCVAFDSGREQQRRPLLSFADAFDDESRQFDNEASQPRVLLHER